MLPSASSITRVLGLGLLVIALGTSLTACAVEAPSTETHEKPESSDASAPVDADAESDEGAEDRDDEQRFGIGLETTAEVIAETLEDVSGYSVDGTTLTITFSEGTTGFDGVMDCLSVSGLMSEDETLILTYPDGSTEC